MNMVNNPPKKPLKVGEISLAIALAHQLAGRLAGKSLEEAQKITVTYEGQSYLAQEVVNELFQFSFHSGWGLPRFSPTHKDLQSFITHAEGFLKESQKPQQQPEGNIPDYITIPDQEDVEATPKKLQVEKYLHELRDQIKDIEKRNFDQRLREARQNIFASKTIIQQEVIKAFNDRIPEESVKNIFKIDEDKFSAALEYAAINSGSHEEMVEQTIASFAQSSLGGRFLANRLDDTSTSSIIAKSLNRMRSQGLTPKLTNSFAVFSEFKKATNNLTDEHFIVGFYENLIKNQPHLSQTEAVSQALKAHSALVILSQTNQPVFSNPQKYQEAFILSMKQTGVSSQTVANLGFGSNSAPLNINDLMLASFSHNQVKTLSSRPTTKPFTIPSGNTINTETINLALQGGLGVFGLNGLMSSDSKKNHADPQKSALNLHAAIDSNHREDAENLLSFLLKKPGKLSFIQRRQAYNLLQKRLHSIQDNARLILLIEKLKPGLLPKELLSGARIISSPLKQAGAWISRQTTRAVVAASRWITKITAKAVQWVIVNTPKAVAAIGGALAKAGAAILAALGPEILITIAIVIAILIIILLIARVAQVPLESMHTYPLPKAISDYVFECDASSVEKPENVSPIFSSDGKYAYPMVGSTGSDACYHWGVAPTAIDIYTGQSITQALDHSTQKNLPIVAYTSGTIVSVVQNDSYGGKYLILRGDDDGRYYYYAHNCVIFPTTGSKVKAGEVIAMSNQTGLNAAITPEHLHFAINSTSTFPSGGGDVCTFTDIREKFGIDTCGDPSKECKPLIDLSP